MLDCWNWHVTSQQANHQITYPMGFQRMSFIRLYLVPSVTGADQQVIDIDSEALVLSNGKFVPVQSAPTITLISGPVSVSFKPFTPEELNIVMTNSAQYRDVRVCWREPVDADQFPNEAVVAAVDPAGGTCVCGVTCMGTDISYVQVSNVEVTA